MGDMADYALGIAANEVEHYERYKDAPLHTQYDEGLIDERGVTLGNPRSTPTNTATIPALRGKGCCPKCGSSTQLKTGKHGKFYGCVTFPNCTGSRNI